MMVHGHIRRSKKDTSQKARQLQKEWEQLKDKWKNQPKFGKPGQIKREEPKPLADIAKPTTAIGQALAKLDYAELELKVLAQMQPALVKPSQVYTGTEMLGTAGLHKSNEVPVFSKEAILEISKMRR